MLEPASPMAVRGQILVATDRAGFGSSAHRARSTVTLIRGAPLWMGGEPLFPAPLAADRWPPAFCPRQTHFRPLFVRPLPRQWPQRFPSALYPVPRAATRRVYCADDFAVAGRAVQDISHAVDGSSCAVFDGAQTRRPCSRRLLRSPNATSSRAASVGGFPTPSRLGCGTQRSSSQQLAGRIRRRRRLVTPSERFGTNVAPAGSTATLRVIVVDGSSAIGCFFAGDRT